MKDGTAQDDKRRTILIADDEAINRKMIAIVFREEYKVVLAENGVEALALLRRSPVEAVILDLMMPQLDGFGVLSAMQEDPHLRDIPVIVVTASTEDSNQIKALDHGAQDVIAKPYNPEVVRHRVSNIIERRIASQKAEEYRTYKKLLRLAEIDEKTGLYTKQAFCRRTSELLKANPDTRYVVCRWDIDRFKVYNDMFGMAAGDELLARIGEAYRNNMEGGILVAGHLEADHFASCFAYDVFMIGFDDCTGDVVWTAEAKGTLRLAAMLIGTFLLKYREHENAVFTEDFVAALENNAEYIYIITPDTHEIIYCNRAIRELCHSDFVGKKCFEEFLGKDAPCQLCSMAMLLATGKSDTVEVQRPDGMWLLTQASPLNWKGRRVIMLTCTDITLKKQAEIELQARNNEYAALVKQSGKQLIRYNLHTGEAVSFFDDSAGEVERRAFADYTEEMIRSGIVLPESADEYRAFYAGMRAGKPSGSCDALVVRHNGEPRWNHADYTLIYDEQGAPTYSIISYYDNDQEMRERQNLMEAAESDALTGAFNRVAMEKRIASILSKNTRERCALLMLDLDNLKEINDMMGHGEGDAAIRLIADTLRKHFKKTDLIGRIGGDEFMILLRSVTSASTLRGMLASLMRSMNNNLLGASKNYTLRCSIGAAFGVAGKNDFQALYKQADLALYYVKRNGKNDFAFYTPEMENKGYQYTPHAGITLANTEWLAAEEYQKLIAALTTYFPLIISVNLTKNSYYMMEYASYATHKSRDAGALNDLIESGASTFHPNDRQGFIDCFSRDALLKAHAEGRKAVVYEGRQLDDDGVYRWVRTRAVFAAADATGDVCQITLAHPIEVEKQNETERLKLQKLLEFTVSASFEYICLIHTQNGRYELYSNDGKNTHTVPKLGNFNKTTQRIMERHIALEERKAYYDAAILESVIRHMEETNGAYTYRYRLEDGEREVGFAWYEPTHTELLMTVRKL